MSARALLAVTLAVFLVVPPAAATLQDDLDEIGSEIRDIQAQIDAAESAESDLASEVNASAGRLDSLVADLAAAEADLVAVADQIADREDSLLAIRDDLEAHYQALDESRRTAAATEERAQAQVISLYMSGGTEAATLLFSVADIMEAAISLEYAARATEHTDEIGRQLDALQLEQQRQAQAVAETEAEVEQPPAEARKKSARKGWWQRALG